MKILILGARGNLGSQLVKVFGDDSIAWDREDLDITQREEVLSKISALKPDVIINATAYNAVDKCEEIEEENALARKLNGEAVANLADAALEINAILIHYSTDYVFNGENERGYYESDNTDPINNYGRSKVLGERALHTKSAQGLKYYLIRTSKLFGPKGPSEVSKPSFFDIMLNLSKERPELKAVDAEFSCFTYTVDLAVKTKELLEESYPFGIYHITNSNPVTWYEAASHLFEIAGIRVKLIAVSSENFPRPARRPNFSVLLNTKMPPLRDFSEALAEYLNL
ncbi:MAG: dTDP-4-dehydrorhamnose reductase [Candidatus Falkowbacteria bacterium]